MTIQCKLTKKQKKTVKLFKETRDKAKALGIEVEDISTKLESVELVLNGTVTSRHIRGADALTVVDADSTATACGPYVSIDIRYDIFLHSMYAVNH